MKRVNILLLVVIMVFFASCKQGLRSIMFDDGGVKADNRMEQLLSTIVDKDREALKSLFSKKVLEEFDDIDSGIDMLFEYLHGNIDSWERDGLSGGNTRREGKITTMNRFNIIINTDKDVYEIFVMDYYTDTINPDNEGIYMLKVYKSSYSGEHNQSRAGIHIVE